MSEIEEKSNENGSLSVDEINHYLSHSKVDPDMIEAEKSATKKISKILPKLSIFNFDSLDVQYSNSSSDDEDDITNLPFTPTDVLKYHKNNDFIQLPISQLQKFFSDPQLDVSHPNRLIRILMKISAHHKSAASSLYHCLSFDALSKRSKVSVLECPDIDHLFAFPDLFNGVAKCLSEKKRHSGKTAKKAVKHVKVDENDQFNGINSYLSIISHGNPYLKGIISVYGNTKCMPVFYQKPGDYVDYYFLSRDRPFSCVFIDFGANRPIVTKYTITSYSGNTMHMKSWDLSGSNDLLHWDLLHLESKNDTLVKKKKFVGKVDPNSENGKRSFRYYRIRQLTQNLNGSNELAISKIELFGLYLNEKATAENSAASNSYNLIEFIEKKLKENSENIAADDLPICFSSDDMFYRLFDQSWTGFYESNDSKYIITENQDDPKRSFLRIDYSEKKICPTHYSVKQKFIISSFLRNWVIEGSNDAITWKVLDERVNDKTLSQSQKTATFKCEVENTECFRFIQISQTGPNGGGDNYLRLTQIEFFGSIVFL